MSPPRGCPLGLHHFLCSRPAPVAGGVASAKASARSVVLRSPAPIARGFAAAWVPMRIDHAALYKDFPRSPAPSEVSGGEFAERPGVERGATAPRRGGEQKHYEIIRKAYDLRTYQYWLDYMCDTGISFMVY